MTDKPIQDFYKDEIAICYGCGRHNEHGLHVQTFWDGEYGIAHFMPKEYHTAFPGFIYGGLLASLIDCHCLGTASAAAYHADGREPGTEPEIIFVTGNLNVTYLKPTPVGTELILKARATKIDGRKVTVECSVYANEEETVKGVVLAVQVPSRMIFSEKDH